MPEKQETYDICVTHLRRQKKKATLVIRGKITGAYRGNNNLKGPVGHLLGPHYLEDFEEWSVKDKLIELILRNILKHDVQLCHDLQKCHDEEDVEYWESSFQMIAAKHKLVYKINGSIPEKVIFPSEEKIVDELLGYLIQGKFVDWKKITETELRQSWPKPIKIHNSNIGNYSQICSRSKMLVVDGLKNKFGKPICLFQY